VISFILKEFINLFLFHFFTSLYPPN